MHEFRKLRVYRAALLLTKDIRQLTRAFPKDELYGLTAQCRKAAHSIVLNIAEGSGRGSDRDFVRFLNYALGSSYECIACLDIALTNDYVGETERQAILQELDRINSMLVGLMRSTRGNDSAPSADR
jgi:four helix bundle protein